MACSLPLAGVVVRLSITAPAELHLEALEIGAVLHNFDKTLMKIRKKKIIEEIDSPF